MTDFNKDEQALFMNISDKDRADLSALLSRLDNATNQENNMQIKEKYLEAINCYLRQGLSVSKILKLLDVKYLGYHYCGSHKRRYELDNTAVGYLLGLSANDMTMFRVSVTLKEDVIPPASSNGSDLCRKKISDLFMHNQKQHNVALYGNKCQCTSAEKRWQLSMRFAYRARKEKQVIHCFLPSKNDQHGSISRDHRCIRSADISEKHSQRICKTDRS